MGIQEQHPKSMLPQTLSSPSCRLVLTLLCFFPFSDLFISPCYLPSIRTSPVFRYLNTCQHSTRRKDISFPARLSQVLNNKEYLQYYLELAHSGLQSQLSNFQEFCELVSLTSNEVGGFMPWELAKATNQGSYFQRASRQIFTSTILNISFFRVPKYSTPVS